VVWGGERVAVVGGDDAWYARPALVSSARPLAVSFEETFAPILYVQPYDQLEAAIADCNAVAQGLSASLITQDLIESELFLSPEGSDCGLANINLGTSGAEIGGAFGGEKETGGGRESGSDSWKAYMRRQTQVLNWSGALPLAQGVKFDVEA
jgi:aldehyde dehydrogenase (NAD+)